MHIYRIHFSLTFSFSTNYSLSVIYFSTPPGVRQNKKLLHTFKIQPSTFFQVLPPVPSSKQIRQFCLKVIFTRALPRLSGIIAREALSHHHISWPIKIRPAGRGLRPRTLRRSRVIRFPQSREAGPW